MCPSASRRTAPYRYVYPQCRCMAQSGVWLRTGWRELCCSVWSQLFLTQQSKSAITCDAIQTVSQSHLEAPRPLWSVLDAPHLVLQGYPCSLGCASRVHMVSPEDSVVLKVRDSSADTRPAPSSGNASSNEESHGSSQGRIQGLTSSGPTPARCSLI